MRKSVRSLRLETTTKTQIMQMLCQTKVVTGKTWYSSPNITIKEYKTKDRIQEKAIEKANRKVGNWQN